MGRLVQAFSFVFLLSTFSTYLYADYFCCERVALGVGEIDLREDENTIGQLAVEGGELEWLWNVRPALLAMVAEQNSYYVGAGVLKEFALGSDWSWALGVAAGYYDQEGSNRDLGSGLEFHTRIHLNWQLNTNNQLRSHLSNASLGDENPGTEAITLNWVYQFGH